MAVVTIPERGYGGAHLLQVAKEATEDHLLLQPPVGTLSWVAISVAMSAKSILVDAVLDKSMRYCKCRKHDKTSPSFTHHASRHPRQA